MAELSFTKYEGLGNDFVVVEAASDAVVTADRAREICDRHFGIGADGVLLVLPAAGDAHARMKVLNADGSVAEMCGNGLRCVAEHVGRARGLTAVRVVTDARTYACERGDGGVVTVDMGEVRRSREARVDGFSVHEVDMGNPHAVIFDGTLLARAAELGPRLEKNPHFSRGANIELVRDEGDVLDVVVWERGVGLTLACGTGACAVARAAIDTGRREAERDIAIRLPGGTLTLREHAGRLIMRGPATRVFEGVYRR